jgi:hypothetical protein
VEERRTRIRKVVTPMTVACSEEIVKDCQQRFARSTVAEDKLAARLLQNATGLQAVILL